jgi:uncharacterized protein YggU (UPF0235/DUF167 family)
MDAAANQALVESLAGKPGCSRGNVELIRGQTSRHKTLILHGCKLETGFFAVFGGMGKRDLPSADRRSFDG